MVKIHVPRCSCIMLASAYEPWMPHTCGFHPTWRLVMLRKKAALGALELNEGSQKHFLWTIVGPDSSYSPLEIHICWKVLSEERMDPPIHTEYLRSGGATTLIFMVDGAKAVSSLVMRSPMPANIVVPPDRTMLL